MSVRKIKKTVYVCRCECVNNDGTPCGHEWESEEIPRRCSLCKRRQWNGVDKRRKQSKAADGR